MQASIRTSMNTVRRHLDIAATVQGLVIAVVIISIGALLPLTVPPAKAVDVAIPNALKAQQIAEWTEINVTQLEAQAQALPSRMIAPDMLKAQQIAQWTEINVTQPAQQGSDSSSATSDSDAAARQALKDQRIADWTEINVTQLAAQGH